MKRRAALVGSGAVLVGAVAARVRADAGATGNYDITLEVQPGNKEDEFLYLFSGSGRGDSDQAGSVTPSVKV